MSVEISNKIVKLILAVGIVFTNYNYLIESSLSETLEEEKKEQILNTNDTESLLKEAKEYQNNGLYKKSILVYEKILKNRNLENIDTKKRIFILDNLGKIYFEIGLLDKAEDLFFQSLSLRKKILVKII